MKKVDDLLEDIAEEIARRKKLIDVTPAAAEPAENAGNGSVP